LVYGDFGVSGTTIRAHVVLPEDLVQSVDRLVGRRKRSEFIAEAVAEKVARLRLVEAAQAVAGSLVDVDIPGWETSKAAAEWVRASRQADEDRLRRTLADP
jgi:metal-responsive CopG/Arc/MetJ family transcriptional regulator